DIRGATVTGVQTCALPISKLRTAGWRYDGDDRTLRWVCDRLIPALRRTPDEIDAVLRTLDGRFIPPGPSGAPTRGMAHVLPTGRDPKSVRGGGMEATRGSQ